MRVTAMITSLDQLTTRRHNQLQELTNDDHPQYLNTARHDTTARHPAATVIPTTAPGDVIPRVTAVEGTATTLARADHRHSAPEVPSVIDCIIWGLI